MPVEPTVKRTVAFIDGQNLFHAAREAFGYTYPNYDVQALAKQLTLSAGWNLDQTRFYTGMPDSGDNAGWHQFWTKKLLAMSRAGIHVYSRPLRYRNKQFELPDGTQHTILVGEEKGIDVRIALDVMRMANDNEFDVALIFSQDQDLSEVVDEVCDISCGQDRWIKVASAFPVSPIIRNKRGINRTDFLQNRKCRRAVSKHNSVNRLGAAVAAVVGDHVSDGVFVRAFGASAEVAFVVQDGLDRLVDFGLWGIGGDCFNCFPR